MAGMWVTNHKMEKKPQILHGLVCKDCFEQNPWKLDLLKTKCLQTHKSSVVTNIHVALNFNIDKLEKIRPLPSSRLPMGQYYVLCLNAGRCRFGSRCTFPHSVPERHAWNDQIVKKYKDDCEAEGKSIVFF